ncbi:MAG: hypothetical protein JO187_03205, partial [Acidobacteria bacterium]|nr:hypothetical protein [Acidobacteriota bacterium]
MALLLTVLALPATAAQWRSRIDLKRLLDDADALHRTTVLYTHPERPGQMFYLHGDGALVLQ